MNEKLPFRVMICFQRIARNLIALLAATTLFALICSVPGSSPASTPSAQSPTHKTSKAKSVFKPAVNEAPVPFHTGEMLQYQVAWATFTAAASVQLSVPERRDLLGWDTWHFRASAHTLNTVRSIFPIDDQFDSYTDTATLESRQYEMYLNESGKKQDRLFRLLPQGQAAHADGPRVIVLPGTRDPLGVLYSLRGVDWQKTTEFRTPLYDGHDIYEIRARQDIADEAISVAAGKFSASSISIRLFRLDKEVSGMSFSAWFAHDTARTPILIQADLPLGSLRAELTSASQ